MLLTSPSGWTHLSKTVCFYSEVLNAVFSADTYLSPQFKAAWTWTSNKQEGADVSEQQMFWRGQMSVNDSACRPSISTRSDWLAVRSTLLISSLYAPADKQEVIHCLTSQLALKADGWWRTNKGTIRPKHSNCGQRATRDKRLIYIKEDDCFHSF